MSLLLLFLPKLHALLKRSSGIVDHSASKATSHTRIDTDDQHQQQSSLMSINHMIATGNLSGLQSDSPRSASGSRDRNPHEINVWRRDRQRHPSGPVYRRIRLSHNRINDESLEGDSGTENMEVHEVSKESDEGHD